MPGCASAQPVRTGILGEHLRPETETQESSIPTSSPVNLGASARGASAMRLRPFPSVRSPHEPCPRLTRCIPSPRRDLGSPSPCDRRGALRDDEFSRTSDPTSPRSATDYGEYLSLPSRPLQGLHMSSNSSRGDRRRVARRPRRERDSLFHAAGGVERRRDVRSRGWALDFPHEHVNTYDVNVGHNEVRIRAGGTGSARTRGMELAPSSLSVLIACRRSARGYVCRNNESGGGWSSRFVACIRPRRVPAAPSRRAAEARKPP